MLPTYYQMPYPVYHQVVTLDPSPSFRWCPRKMPMNWNLIRDVDVDAIEKSMDIDSLEYLVQHIAFANLTNDDSKKFSSIESLKAFKLLQLGVEYLTHLKRPLPTQPDSSDLRKALSECQQKVEELQTLLHQSEQKREKAESSCAIYKRRFNALKLQMHERDDEDGEVRGIDSKTADPLLDVKKELEEMRALVNERGRTLSERADRWSARMSAPEPIPKTANARDIADLFIKSDKNEKKKKTQHRYVTHKEASTVNRDIK